MVVLSHDPTIFLVVMDFMILHNLLTLALCRARMQRYREESELLDESGRLDLDVFSALGSGLHGTAARVSQVS